MRGWVRRDDRIIGVQTCGMKSFARQICCLAAAVALFTGCTTVARRGEEQIRERLFAIRAAILAKDAGGIVRWGSDDWTFVDQAGQTFDRAAYLVRVKGLFDRVVSIDSLETRIDRIAIQGDEAHVEITQTMERHERETAAGLVQHVRLRYREAQIWVWVGQEWRVRRVAFTGVPERTVLGGR